MLRMFQQMIHIPGTLSANVVVKYAAPVDCQLVHLSAVASNASDGRVKLGTSADDDAFLTYTDLGAGGTPVEIEGAANWRSATVPRIQDGDVVVITVDYGGGAGTAAADVTLLLTFTEG